MPIERVVVIGAGIGGLVSAALLAARGCDVTLLEAAAGPGGKLRAVTVDAIDGGPTVFTMRAVFEDIFAACGATLDDHLKMRPATIIARHAWGDGGLDLYADPAASEAAIGDFAGAADARSGVRRAAVPPGTNHDGGANRCRPRASSTASVLQRIFRKAPDRKPRRVVILASASHPHRSRMERQATGTPDP